MKARQDRRGGVIANSGRHAAIRELGTLFTEGAVGMLSDGQLLDRFVERREASAFEAIVERYGPLVWGVCRRVLRDHHDAEDAFQATFLVLARKAASVMPREKLGNWLYGAAFQTAMKARATRAKRRVRERQAWEMTEPEAVPDEHADDQKKDSEKPKEQSNPAEAVQEEIPPPEDQPKPAEAPKEDQPKSTEAPTPKQDQPKPAEAPKEDIRQPKDPERVTREEVKP